MRLFLLILSFLLSWSAGDSKGADAWTGAGRAEVVAAGRPSEAAKATATAKAPATAAAKATATATAKATVASAEQDGSDRNPDYDAPALLPSQTARFSGEDTSIAHSFRTTNSGRRTQVSQKSPFRFVKAGKVIDRRNFYTFRTELHQFQTGVHSTSRYIHTICHLLIQAVPDLIALGNILLILGCSAVITPLSFGGMDPIDACALIFSSALLLTWAFTGRKCRIDRWEGTVMLLAFAAYYYHLFTKL